VNGHRYIGFTTQGLEIRRSQHVKAARGQQTQYKFQRAMAKYGVGSFSFRVLGDFGDDEDLAKVYEMEAIAGYRPEYNLSFGGDGGSMPPEVRAKISANRKGYPGTWLGKKFSEEHRARISKSLTGSKHPWARFKSVEARRKTSESLKGHPNYYKGVPVVCTTDGNSFESVKEAACFYGLPYDAVTKVLKGRKPSVKGLVFSYRDTSK